MTEPISSAAIDIDDRPTTEDREWCAQLMAFSEPWITLGRTIEQTRPLFDGSWPGTTLLIARAHQKPLGFLLLRERGIVYSPYIASLAASSDARSLGIGSRLIALAEERERPNSRYIFLCVSSFNARARALYERHGYAVVGELKDYIKDGFSEVLMSKRLRP